MNEAQLQDKVVTLAHTGGWLVHHGRAARNAAGDWSTPLQGDPGYVDLTLVHPTRGLFVLAELKSANGVVSPAQHKWHTALRHAGVDIRLWRPVDWPSIVALLTPGARAL